MYILFFFSICKNKKVFKLLCIFFINPKKYLNCYVYFSLIQGTDMSIYIYISTAILLRVELQWMIILRHQILRKYIKIHF